MPNTIWSRLSHLQLGRYAEYYAKMEFTSHGFEVYTSEVDDRGIDFICRKEGHFYEIQVKSLRDSGYTFIRKDHMSIDSLRRYVCFLRFEDGSLPDVYLFPATAWQTPTSLLSSRDYEGKKSLPEWGISISQKTAPSLEAFRIERVLSELATNA